MEHGDAVKTIENFTKAVELFSNTSYSIFQTRSNPDYSKTAIWVIFCLFYTNLTEADFRFYTGILIWKPLWDYLENSPANKKVKRLRFEKGNIK